ncbi:hypothetical protein BKH42_07780 [Helicobacter sp. 13S00482-2]|nr:hypothetical protein BKH42_07780 [Helicobacter sp. 13S00482-2]
MGDAKNEEGLWTLPVGQIQVKAHAGISILLAEHHRIEFIVKISVYTLTDASYDSPTNVRLNDKT